MDPLKIYFLFKMGIFQPAMLVYSRVNFISFHFMRQISGVSGRPHVHPSEKHFARSPEAQLDRTCTPLITASKNHRFQPNRWWNLNTDSRRSDGRLLPLGKPSKKTNMAWCMPFPTTATASLQTNNLRGQFVNFEMLVLLDILCY